MDKKQGAPFAWNVGGRGSGGSGGGRGGNTINVDFTPKKKPTKKFWIIFAICAVVIIGFCYWWFHPSLNIHSGDLWVFVSIFILIPAAIIFWVMSKFYSHGTPKNVPNVSKANTFHKLIYIPLGIICIGILGALLSATFFPGNAKRYANVLQTQEYDFASDIQEVDYTQIPVIDKDSAVLLGNRAMGSIADYVSQFEISDLYSQINYHDTPVRVSPLGYADFFKWLTNRVNGIPAYAIVDMTTQDAEIARTDEAIHYSQSEPFCRNIDRYVQLKYPFYLFDELSFEIDEDGHPWWICPVQNLTIGLFGGETISRVILVDACSGECQDLAVEDCPEWVDRVYPADLLIKQYNWSGRYLNGWWNSWIGQSGVHQTTPGTSTQLGYNYIAKDDDVWVYTGVTSSTGDNSIIGFVLINQRTAESHFYSVAGATEESAMASAEGQVQNLKYTSTFPLLLNINSQPTYFMALKDNAGLVKKYAMIDIQRYQNVAVGDTVSDCQKSYKALLATNGVTSDTGEESTDLPETTGIVSHISQAVIEGNTHFYVILKGDSNIYDCPIPSIMEVVALSEGDTVTLQYTEGDPTCTVTEIVEMKSPEEVSASAATGTGAATSTATNTGSTTTPTESTSASTASSTGS